MTAPDVGALHELAGHHQVATHFWDWHGNHQEVSAQTLRKVLCALGALSASEDTGEALARSHSQSWRRTLPATTVVTFGQSRQVHVHVPHGDGLVVEVALEGSDETVTLAHVDRWVEPRDIDGHLVGEATVEVPDTLPLGYHTIGARVGSDIDKDVITAAGHLFVVPAQLPTADPTNPEALTRGWGMACQLYQTRSSDSWGIGDLADLSALLTWAADEGASFVLINPIHASEPIAPIEPSPYLPTSRLFRSPMYLRPQLLPEWSQVHGDQADELAQLAQAARQLNTNDRIDREASWRLKRRALEILYAQPHEPERIAAFARYRDQRGDALQTFATWCALADDHGVDTRTWPAGIADPRSEDVATFVTLHAARIEFHSWLQWLVDEQVDSVHQLAVESGMEIGVVHDLAVGVHPERADVWSLPESLVHGVSVGAPPDQFNQLGQDWAQPPWHPEHLAETGYAAYVQLVRGVLRGGGGVRIDHIIGLFRLWWIPDGSPPTDGTYVHYDDEALLGILALEAHRAGAVIIGEDLGLVEPRARTSMAQLGMLGTSILWFEWVDGQPLAPENYRPLCLASVTTHDLPPTAGYLALEHVALRNSLGLLTRPEAEERDAEAQAVETMRARLIGEGLLSPESDDEDLVVALHEHIARSAAVLVAASVADLAGDRQIVNQPGTVDEHPNWRLPLADADGAQLPLERLIAHGRPAIADRIITAMQTRT